MAGNRISAYEKTTLRVTGVLTETTTGEPLALSTFDVFFMSIYLDVSATTRLFIRSSDDILADPNFTVDESGNMVWLVQPFETQILQPDQVSLLSTEDHAVLLEFCWNSPRSGTISNPFSTVADSKVVTVTLPAHGLEVRNSVWFKPTDDVGGLDLGGQYIVRSVVDVDTFTIEHLSAATATATDEGNVVDWFAQGKSGVIPLTMKITRVDPV